MKHEIATFNQSGKRMYEHYYKTANEAYEAYNEVIDNLQNNLPKGYEATVVRFNEGKIMSMTTVQGNN